MRSTFMGLETSKRGMFTQQSALYTTGHNISNANTLGYTRQRVNMEATTGFPGIGLNAPTTPGFIGTGVQAGSIERIRDSFVDQQYRQETNKLGYWESKSKAISQMEDILNEPSDYGLAKTLNDFWKSLQDLSVNPENSGARRVVLERGTAVADSFHYMYNSLKQIQSNLSTEISTSESEVNSLLEQIAQLNGQIDAVEPNGYLPNDLYDARDQLLDQLSNFFPIEVSYGKAGGNASSLAKGPLTVSLVTSSGKHVVIDNKSFGKINTEFAPPDATKPDVNPPIEGITITTANGTSEMVSFSDFSKSGKLRSLMDSYGTSDGKGLYSTMLEKLDEMASDFIDKFNAAYAAGYPDPDATGTVPTEFFKGNSASSIEVIVTDPNHVRASSVENAEGNGENAKKLSDVIQTPIKELQAIIGQLGVDGQQAERNRFNTETLRDSVDLRRQSISSVSLDEEMTNMIKFQQAYNASARMITVVDETLDKIINGMGRGGL